MRAEIEALRDLVIKHPEEVNGVSMLICLNKIITKGEERYYSEQTMAAVVKMRDEAQERAEAAEAALATLREQHGARNVPADCLCSSWVGKPNPACPVHAAPKGEPKVGLSYLEPEDRR